MAGHPIENIMKTTMENLKEMIDVNTIVGDAVETEEGVVIIPISKVSFGFVAGGGEYQGDTKESKRTTSQDAGKAEASVPFAGGSGAGVSVNPIAFLIVGEDKIKLLPVNFNSSVDRIIDMVPQVVEEIQNMIEKNRDKSKITMKTESEKIKQ